MGRVVVSVLVIALVWTLRRLAAAEEKNAAAETQAWSEHSAMLTGTTSDEDKTPPAQVEEAIIADNQEIREPTSPRTWFASLLERAFPKSMVFQLRLLWGRCTSLLESVAALRESVLPSPTEVLSTGDWVEVTLMSAKPIGNTGCTQYKFRLGTSRQTFGLQLGQTLSLLGIDLESKTTHRVDLIPASRREQTGFFEVVLEDVSPDVALGMRSPSATTDIKAFTYMLQEMEIGNQIAAKPGLNRLNYAGEVPITDVLFVVNGVGVSATLNLLRELLPRAASSVERASVVYVNKDQDDFIAVDELENLWFKYSRQLDVSCVLDEDPIGPDLWMNEAFNSSIPHNYRHGTMVVLAGSESFKESVGGKLVTLGYPQEALVDL